MRTNKEIINYLNELKSKQNLSISEIARRVGMAKSAVSRYFNFSREFPLNRVDQFAKAFHVSSEDILGIEKDADILPIYNQLDASRQHKVYTYAQTQLNEQNNINDENTTYITAGRSTAAGLPIDGDSEDALQQQLVVSRDEIPRGADEVITIAGDSMEPDLPKGSKQFIHYQPVPDSDGQIMVVNIKDEGVTCKKLYRDGDKIKLVSINDKYEPMIYPADEIKVIGKVIDR